MWNIKFVILLLCNCLIYAEVNTEDTWTGKWFPRPPKTNDIIEKQDDESIHDNHNIQMGIKDPKCDNGEDNLTTDFDPNSEIDKLMYTCLDNSTKYDPSYKFQPILTEYTIPPAYVPLHKCMNESINYDIRLPTYGTHRPNWPKYGEYKFVPIQRWLHTIEHGGIVMLYHPCANHKEIDKLRLIVKSCLYRYVITSSKRLLPERPLALIAWGKSLELSAVYPPIILDFIKMNALKGPEKISKDGQYNKLLIENAKIVSDQDDSNLCPNNKIN